MSQSDADGVFGFEFYEYENKNSSPYLYDDFVTEFLSLKGNDNMKFIRPSVYNMSTF